MATDIIFGRFPEKGFSNTKFPEASDHFRWSSNEHSRSHSPTNNLQGDIHNVKDLEIQDADTDISSELNNLFDCPKTSNDDTANQQGTGSDTCLFLYSLNGLFDEFSDCDINEKHFSEGDSTKPSALAECPTEESTFLSIIDVDALLEVGTQELKSSSAPARDCIDVDTKAWLLFADNSSSEDSDDDLGFRLFGDESNQTPVAVNHQTQSTQCCTERTPNNNSKPSQTESSEESDSEESEDDLGFSLFCDDEDSVVTKKAETVNSTHKNKKPPNKTNSRTANSNTEKKTVITCARACEKNSSDKTNFDHCFENMMGAAESRQFVKRSDSEIDHCVICMDKITNPRILHKCSHQFCADCITGYFKVRPQCPVCFVVYGVIEGNQPKDGTMTHTINNRLKLPGYEKHKTIIVYYDFPDGVQTEEHPNPGQQYYGTSRTAYLPDDAEGRKVLKLLQEAFKRRLVFTVGRSRTTGADNQVTWNDIHHKTCTNGGQQGFGYPDPTYLARVQEELAAFGVTEESIRENT